MAIKHKAVKASRDKGYATEWNDDHEIDGDVDFEHHEAQNMIIHSGTAFPAGPVEGQMFYRTDLNELYFWDNSAWVFLKRKLNYWSCSGVNFVQDSTSEHGYDEDEGVYYSKVNNQKPVAPVFLPDGAVVTGCVVYGNFGNNWILRRSEMPYGAGWITMAEAGANTEDITISDATIDNSKYNYYLVAQDVDVDEYIAGARITYNL